MSNDQKNIQPFIKNCLMQITAGGSAGFIEICIMHPLDVIKKNKLEIILLIFYTKIKTNKMIGC